MKKYKNPPTFSKWKVVRGDKVAITRGPHKGDQGTVLKVHRKKNMVTVDNTRVVRKAVKGTEENPGGITSFPAKFHVSAVALVDPVSGKPTRVSFRYQEDGTKVRVAKKSGSIIPRPDALTERTTARRMDVEFNDTAEEDVWQRTYVEPEYVAASVAAPAAEADTPPPPPLP